MATRSSTHILSVYSSNQLARGGILQCITVRTSLLDHNYGALPERGKFGFSTITSVTEEVNRGSNLIGREGRALGGYTLNILKFVVDVDGVSLCL